MRVNQENRYPDFGNEEALLTNPAFVAAPKFHIRSRLEIWIRSLLIGVAVFTVTLAIQWVIYDRMLHQDGLRYVGSGIAAVISMLLVQHMETTTRLQRIEEASRLEIIALMNHHIRNSLQAFVNIAGTSDSTEKITTSVTRIEWVLSEVVTKLQPNGHKR